MLRFRPMNAPGKWSWAWTVESEVPYGPYDVEIRKFLDEVQTAASGNATSDDASLVSLDAGAGQCFVDENIGYREGGVLELMPMCQCRRAPARQGGACAAFHAPRDGDRH
jgi:hypothetical protein